MIFLNCNVLDIRIDLLIFSTAVLIVSGIILIHNSACAVFLTRVTIVTQTAPFTKGALRPNEHIRV